MLISAVVLAQVVAPLPTPDPTLYLLVNSNSAWSKSLYRPVAPVFPAELRSATQLTTVVIDAVLDSQGKMTRASIVQGDPRAHEAALRAAMQWGFEPPEREPAGHPVRLSFTFRTLPAAASFKELEPDFSSKYRVEVRATVAPRSRP